MNMQLSKTPIGLDGVPAAETVLSHVDGERGELIIAGERVGDLAAQDRFRGRDRPAVERRNRPAGRRSRGPRRPRRRARARLRPAAGAARHHAGPVDRRRFSRGDRGAARRSGTGARGHHRRRVSGDRRRAGAAREGQRSDRARSDREPCRRYAVDDAGPQARCARGGGARRLFRHRVRPRHECLDLHDARGGLDPGRSVRRRHRRLLRADRAAAWRRAGAGAGNARRDRLDASASSRGSTARWRAASG